MQVIGDRYYFYHAESDLYVQNVHYIRPYQGKTTTSLPVNIAGNRLPKSKSMVKAIIMNGKKVVLSNRTNAIYKSSVNTLLNWFCYKFDNAQFSREETGLQIRKSIVYETEPSEVIETSVELAILVRSWLRSQDKYGELGIVPTNLDFTKYKYAVMMKSDKHRVIHRGSTIDIIKQRTNEVRIILRELGVKQGQYRSTRGAFFFKELDQATLARLSIDNANYIFVDLHKITGKQGNTDEITS